MKQLMHFFVELDEEAKKSFHPHPFNEETAVKIVSLSSKDLYFGTIEDDEMVAYGMLRGWEDGYEVPSIGVAVLSGRRHQGLGKEMMEYLIGVARDIGAPAIMLHVYKENPAKRLYENLGFVMEQSPRKENELKGFLKF